MQAWYGEVRPAEVDTHQPGEKHSDEDGCESQSVVLFPDYFVIQTEYVLPDETGRRLMSRMSRIVHFRTSRGFARNFETLTAKLLASSTNCRSLPATSRKDRLSCCSAPGRTVGCRQSHIGRPLLQGNAKRDQAREQSPAELATRARRRSGRHLSSASVNGF